MAWADFYSEILSALAIHFECKAAERHRYLGASEPIEQWPTCGRGVGVCSWIFPRGSFYEISAIGVFELGVWESFAQRSRETRSAPHSLGHILCLPRSLHFCFAFFFSLAVGGRRLGLVLVIYKTAQICVGSGSNYVRYYSPSPLRRFPMLRVPFKYFPRNDDRMSPRRCFRF